MGKYSEFALFRRSSPLHIHIVAIRDPYEFPRIGIAFEPSTTQRREHNASSVIFARRRCRLTVKVARRRAASALAYVVARDRHGALRSARRATSRFEALTGHPSALPASWRGSLARWRITAERPDAAHSVLNSLTASLEAMAGARSASRQEPGGHGRAARTHDLPRDCLVDLLQCKRSNPAPLEIS